MNDTPLLEVRNLSKYFPVKRNTEHFLHAVENVSLYINRGETLGLVGESGCGKTTLGRCILRIYEPECGRIVYDGDTLFDSETKTEADMRPYRRRMQLIFQDPAASLDKQMTIGEIIGEAIDIHKLAVSERERAEKIRSLLIQVGLSAEHANRFPHEFSGGQQQRIGIARALAVKPEFIVCDEPVSSLDVSVSSQIVNMLEDMQDELKLTYLFIAHDMSVVRQISDRVCVMYMGGIVELGEKNELMRHPIHPYTMTLLSAVPIPDPVLSRNKSRIILEGEVPNPIFPPSGCRFHTRCPYAKPLCSEEAPEFKEYGAGHWAACHLLN